MFGVKRADRHRRASASGRRGERHVQEDLNLPIKVWVDADALPNDIKDIILRASRLVDKGLIVIDPRGDLYSEDSIGERLSIRDFMAGLRDSGIQTGGPPPFSTKARQRFASALDRELTRALRASGSS